MQIDKTYSGFEYDERPINLINYIPRVYAEIEEEKAIQASITYEFELLYQELKKIADGSFIFDADEEYIEKWEKLLGITPPYGEGLNSRRTRIFALWNATATYTEKDLVELLNSLWGEGDYSLDIDYENYNITISFLSGDYGIPVGFTTIEQAVRNLVPANMTINYEFRFYKIEDIHNVKTIAEVNDLKLNGFAG